MHRAFDCDLMTYGMMKGKKAGTKARADEKKAKKGEKEGVEAK